MFLLKRDVKLKIPIYRAATSSLVTFILQIISHGIERCYAVLATAVSYICIPSVARTAHAQGAFTTIALGL